MSPQFPLLAYLLMSKLPSDLDQKTFKEYVISQGFGLYADDMWDYYFIGRFTRTCSDDCTCPLCTVSDIPCW